MDNFNINLLRNQLDCNSEIFNRFKIDQYAKTLECIVMDVNEKDMTVTVFIPLLSSKIQDVLIGNNVIGDSASIILPTIKQKGILLLSSNHKPVLLSTIPDELIDNKTLIGESKIGSDDCFVKISKDKSISMKALNSMLSLRAGQSTELINEKIISGNGFNVKYKNDNCIENYNFCESIDSSKEKNYFLINGEINHSIKDEVLLNNSELLTKLNLLIEDTENLINQTDLGEDNAIDKLQELKSKIKKEYLINDDINSVCIEKGNTIDNLKSDSALSIKYSGKDDAKHSLYFHKDGTIILNCKDFIIKKGE